MNKRNFYIIGGIIIVVVILFVMRDSLCNIIFKTQSEGALKTMLSNGASAQCTFKESAGIAETDGTVYMANGKLRGDFNSVDSTVTTKAHMVISNGYTYTWVDGVNVGFKVPYTGTGTDTTGQTLNIDVIKNPTCTSWLSDNSKFSLPTGVSFPTLPTSQK